MTLLELFEDYDGDATSERRSALVEALQKADKILAGLDEGRSALLAEYSRLSQEIAEPGAFGPSTG